MCIVALVIFHSSQFLWCHSSNGIVMRTRMSANGTFKTAVFIIISLIGACTIGITTHANFSWKMYLPSFCLWRSGSCMDEGWEEVCQRHLLNQKYFFLIQMFWCTKAMETLYTCSEKVAYSRRVPSKEWKYRHMFCIITSLKWIIQICSKVLLVGFVKLLSNDPIHLFFVDVFPFKIKPVKLIL